MLNNLQPLEIKQLNITCTTMENPLSACYSDIHWNVHFLCAFFSRAPSNNFDEVEHRRKKQRNLRVDHRKIHLKNSFRFYWFRINVSIDRRSNKRALVVKRQNADRSRQPQALQCQWSMIHIRCTFYVSSGMHTYSKYTHNHSFSHSAEAYTTATANRATRVWVCARMAFRKIHFGCKNRGIFEF